MRQVVRPVFASFAGQSLLVAAPPCFDGRLDQLIARRRRTQRSRSAARVLEIWNDNAVRFNLDTNEAEIVTVSARRKPGSGANVETGTIPLGWNRP